MSRGFARGIVFGGVVAVLGLGFVSQIFPPPSGAANRTEPPRPLEPAAQTGEAVPVSPPEATDAPAEGQATGGEASGLAQNDTEALPAPEGNGSVQTEPDAAPGTAVEPPAEATPEMAENAGDTSTAAPPPAVAEPADSTPAEPSAMTVPPTAPDLPAPPSGPVAQPSREAALEAPPLSGAPTAPGVEMGPPDAELPPPPPLSAEEEALLQPPAAPIEEVAPAEIVPAPPPVPGPAEVGVQPPPDVPPSSFPGPSTAEATRPETPPGLRPDAALPSAGSRLPRIGDLPAEAEAASPDMMPEATGDGPPLARFARRFDNPAGKPAFAILLIDTGGPALDRERLAALDFPVTFVIDPQAPDAAAAEAIYRAAGQEVAMLATGIPAGASAGDLEQTFQANGAGLPESVAVVDLGSGGFQDNRPLASLVVPVIKAQGRGLVTWDRGLNAADQVARREAVPAARIFRRLDAEGEAAPVIRRYLDRAAFKAAQEGRVTVIGETRPETVAALLEWTVEGRAAQVALAPLTAVLTAD